MNTDNLPTLDPTKVTFDEKQQPIFDMMDEDAQNLQRLIQTGQVWRMEGASGRAAMNALESGCCFLSSEPKTDYYGNIVPAYSQVKEGTKGSLSLSEQYWNNK